MLFGLVKGVEKVLVLRIDDFAVVTSLGIAIGSSSANDLKAVLPNLTEVDSVKLFLLWFADVVVVETEPAAFVKRETGVDHRVVTPLGVGGGVVKTTGGDRFSKGCLSSDCRSTLG